MSVEQIVEQARSGALDVRQELDKTFQFLAVGVAAAINIFNPEVVVLGGGVIDALEDEMMAVIIETAKDYAMNGTTEGIEITATKVGDDAGILGAAVLARRETKG